MLFIGVLIYCSLGSVFLLSLCYAAKREETIGSELLLHRGTISVTHYGASMEKHL
jgi:hypothetical protein